MYVKAMTAPLSALEKQERRTEYQQGRFDRDLEQRADRELKQLETAYERGEISLQGLTARVFLAGVVFAQQTRGDHGYS